MLGVVLVLVVFADVGTAINLVLMLMLIDRLRADRDGTPPSPR